MRLEPLLKNENVVVLEGCEGRDDVLARLADLAASQIEGLTASDLFEALADRERRYPTSTPEGVAFPHAMLEEISETLVIAARLGSPIEFRPGEHGATRLVFGIFGSASRPFQHVQLLARLAMIVRTEASRKRLFEAPDDGSLFEALVAEDRSHG